MLRRSTFIATALVCALLIAAGILSPATSDPAGGTQVPTLTEHNALEQRVTDSEALVAELQTRADTADTLHADLEQRVAALEAWAATAPQPTPTPTPTPDPDPEPDPEPTPDPAGFPTPESVGPTVEPTVQWTEGCYFDAADNGRVIDGVIIDCADTGGVKFAADVENVTIRNSVIYGRVFTPGNEPGDAAAETFPRAPIFTVEDSRIIQTSTAEWQDRAACCSHFVIKRSLVVGTHSGVGGHNNVTLEGNYITTDGTDSHSSGMRVLRNTVIRGNTVVCKPVTPGSDGGCSAAGVYYSEAINGVSAAAYNLTIDGNYFKRGVTPTVDTDGDGVPDAGGEPGGPWNATRFISCATRTDCTGISFTDNQIDLGWGVDAGEFPFYGGNVWSGNTWVDGQPAESGQVR